MEARELPIIPEKEINERTKLKEKSKYFTKLQAFMLLFAALIVSVGGAFFVSEKYLWSNSDQSRLDKQIDYYQALVDDKPNNAENRVNLGYSYFIKGDNDNAIKQLKVATDLDSKYFGAYFNLGLVYIKEERYNDALKQAQKAVELGPRNFKAHLLSGMVYRNLKMYDEANKSLKEALKLMPTNTDIITEIGRVAEDQGKRKEAEKFFKEALTYDPLYKPASEGLERIAAKGKDNK
ncbi:tetratricopeptide repeat protein [Neobacillus bataviensis]|uniref:tetratricopeptide repeat protein n=1 Tax=Neobacillus bataviensis TaxID=220685 RepID=UPI001CBDE1A7|nr:tetratricopeptide repeat protein [Neobacillus bataviensis]